MVCKNFTNQHLNIVTKTPIKEVRCRLARCGTRPWGSEEGARAEGARGGPVEARGRGFAPEGGWAIYLWDDGSQTVTKTGQRPRRRWKRNRDGHGRDTDHLWSALVFQHFHVGVGMLAFLCAIVFLVLALVHCLTLNVCVATHSLWLLILCVSKN